MMGSAIYSKIITSNGKQTTTVQNTVINFSHSLLQLTIETFDKALHIRIDNSDVIEIDADRVFIINEMQIENMTIIDSNVQYRWTGMY
ncbi:hypothetical protein Ccar_16150 [Clostridium carboxidivorans P7]|uniref:Uncharacterized protein n=1 Tax=Clostridium carboxidivorans P7 TaxID=536227 RepID=C6Q150_9CLOT|nr:hypothetical protein [Clostridium carboxidivorans]AKN32311.1 hypothetical protein Ccar_16150 [Clostridium carboxidivorans P7]EET84786.1 hypothetical protein CcarbDRAFT_4767 [Clostridium carboxidivorans P7]